MVSASLPYTGLQDGRHQSLLQCTNSKPAVQTGSQSSLAFALLMVHGYDPAEDKQSMLAKFFHEKEPHGTHATQRPQDGLFESVSSKPLTDPFFSVSLCQAPSPFSLFQLNSPKLSTDCFRCIRPLLGTLALTICTKK